jgi:hypothetical protein
MKAVKENVIRKRRPGRPATGQDPVTALRLSVEMKSKVSDWAKRQPDQPSRSEALRRLVEMALKIKDKRQ